MRMAVLGEAVSLRALERWSEDADQTHPRLGAQDVGVVLVERVHGPGKDAMDLAVLDHFAFALDAIARLEVVLVLEQALGSGVDDGVGEAVAHAVAFEQEA